MREFRFRPESPYGRGVLDLAIETASTRVARLGCTRVAGFHRIGGRIIVQRLCSQWQHNVAFSGSIPLQPAQARAVSIPL
jgi:hypothetical protein